jgi:sugar lactone lactonase YvrE
VIRRSNLDGTGVEVVIDNLNAPSGLALDTTNEWIYWTELGSQRILRSSYNGVVQEVVVANSVIARSVVLDVPNGKMYWGDQSPGSKTPTIRRANLDGSDSEVLVDNFVFGAVPTTLALDLVNEHLYWSDFGLGRISRSDLDGSNVQSVFDNLGDPVGIALDVSNDMIYWAEDGDPTTSPAIQRGGLDGTGIETLVSAGLERPLGIALDLVNEEMFWTDFSRGTISAANLDGSNERILLSNQSYPRQIILGPTIDLTLGPSEPPNPNPVPLPPAAWLFASALGVFGYLGKRKANA